MISSSILLETAKGQVGAEKRQSIDITSSFKPVLRNAAKINFTASSPVPDTGRPVLSYKVPVSHIIPGLQPVALEAIAMNPDSSSPWKDQNYVKAGFGNLSTPYLEAALVMGGAKSKLNLSGDHISSNGKLQFQNYSRTGVQGRFHSQAVRAHEVEAGMGLRQHTYYQYGFDSALYKFEKDQLRSRFSTLSFSGGIRNTEPTTFGLTYQPRLEIDFFADNRNNNETNAVLDLPLSKQINDAFRLNLGVKADLTGYHPDDKDKISNNLVTVPVNLLYRVPGLRLQAGIIPSWDNGRFHLLPSILAEFPLREETWVLQAGWLGYYNKGSYMNLSETNPFLAPPVALRNTRIVEGFGGFKGLLFQKFSYNAKIGVISYFNIPLFVNDDASGKSFQIIFEEQLNAMQFQAEAGYTTGDAFSVTAGVNWFSFNEQKTETRAWGLIPFELKAHLRWLVMKNLYFKSDLFLWDGPLYKKIGGPEGRLGGAVDLNAGFEFRVREPLFLWAQFNNITASKYQRWNQYTNYGFNMIAGLRFVF